MSLSVVEIYNHALAMAGTRSSVTSVVEESREAELCNQFYPAVREQVFASAHWSCGKTPVRLALLKERSSDAWTSVEPTPPWQFAYAKPADCCHPRYLTDFQGFELGRYGTSNAINTNAEEPILIYTKVETDTGLWDIHLSTAVYTALAAMVAGPLSGSSRKKKELLEEANRQIMMGRAGEANMDFTHYEAMPEWLSARGISGLTNPNRFIYPVGPLFISGAA